MQFQGRGHFNGAMEELSGQVQKASTHGSSVRVDIAVVEHDCAAVDEDATSILPNKKARQEKRAPQRGDGVVSWCRKWSTYSLRAHEGATHSMSVKASTPSGRWRKCQAKFRRRALTPR